MATAATSRRIADASIEAVKKHADLVDLVGSVIDLRKAGREFVGLCPFHDERSPSFYVNPAKGVYLCRGCGAKGDAIDFIRETEKLDFTDAVEWLANRCDVDLDGAESSGTVATLPRRSRRPEPAPDSPAWLAWYALGGTVADARADDPSGDARSWITHCIREAHRTLDLDTLACLLGAFGVPFPDERPGRGGAWYAIELEALVRDAHYDHDDAALARCLDAIDRVAA
jgi:hypothetical protein